MTDNYVTSEDRKWYTMIPNIVDDMGLDPYAFRLYAHLRRVAGDTGACWQSTDTLAKHCKMGEGSVSKAKQALKAAKLIRIELRTRNGTRYHHITIIDIWAKNMAVYEAARSQGEGAHSPGETKNIPSKKATPTVDKTRPSGDVPSSCEEWLERVKHSKNKNATLRWMFMTLYSDVEPPSYGRVGKMAKHKFVGGHARLAQLLWISSAYRVTGDPLSYCIGLARGQNGKHDNTGQVEQRNGQTVVKVGH